jgi:hypothetical protein
VVLKCKARAEYKGDEGHMVRVSINGRYEDMNLENVPRFTDLLELIKSQIDPEHMITTI